MQYRRNSHRRKLSSLALLLFLAAAFLASCVAGSNTLFVGGFLGLGTTGYETESTESVLPVDGEVAASLCETLDILLGDTVKLQTFRGSADALGKYRDQILISMIRNNYSFYNCDSQLTKEAKAAYPHANYTTLVPCENFENYVIRHFGGSSVSNRDGEIFSYLSKIECYTSAVPVRASSVAPIVERVEQTAHTYRMKFRLTDGNEESKTYTAVFVLREDGDFFITSLS